MSPHTAALTNECKIRMGKETAQNIIDFFENKVNKNMLVKLWLIYEKNLKTLAH